MASGGYIIGAAMGGVGGYLLARADLKGGKATPLAYEGLAAIAGALVGGWIVSSALGSSAGSPLAGGPFKQMAGALGLGRAGKLPISPTPRPALPPIFISRGPA
jgi:hypothetical protein